MVVSGHAPVPPRCPPPVPPAPQPGSPRCPPVAPAPQPGAGLRKEDHSR